MLESEIFALLERTTDTAFAISEDGEIVYWNKAAERPFGRWRSGALLRTFGREDRCSVRADGLLSIHSLRLAFGPASKRSNDKWRS